MDKIGYQTVIRNRNYFVFTLIGRSLLGSKLKWIVIVRLMFSLLRFYTISDKGELVGFEIFTPSHSAYLKKVTKSPGAKGGILHAPFVVLKFRSFYLQTEYRDYYRY